MQIKLICVGNIKEKYYVNAINKITKEINEKNELIIIELKDEAIPNNPSCKVIEQIKTKEGSVILARLNKSDYVIALCIDGKTIEKNKLNEMIRTKLDEEKNVVLIIGGSLGLSEQVIERANFKLSFSKMTFPHQLMRVMLLDVLKE